MPYIVLCSLFSPIFALLSTFLNIYEYFLSIYEQKICPSDRLTQVVGCRSQKVFSYLAPFGRAHHFLPIFARLSTFLSIYEQFLSIYEQKYVHRIDRPQVVEGRCNNFFSYIDPFGRDN